MCPTCNSVLKDVCGKVNCRNENGQKPCKILAACNLQTLFKVSEVYSSSYNDNDGLNHSSNSSVALNMVDSIDLANKLPLTVNSASICFVVALWSKLAPPTQESEIIGKRFARIYTVGKKVLLYVGRATKRFLLDSDSTLTHIELNCLKLHQPGCRRYIESILDHLDPDTTVFSRHNIIAMISEVSWQMVLKELSSD